MEIKVIGLGGIGGCLVPTLARYLAYQVPDSVLTLIDGDSYEEDNRRRQRFPRLGNKAEVTREVLEQEVPLLSVRHEPVYFLRDNAHELVYNADIVFLCADNHPTRKLLSRHGEDLPDIALFSGSNDEETEGTVQVFVNQGGNNLALPLANKHHPEIMNAGDFRPRAQGCEEQAPSRPQMLLANQTAATLMLNIFYGFLEGNVDCDEIRFDAATNDFRKVRWPR